MTSLLPGSVRFHVLLETTDLIPTHLPQAQLSGLTDASPLTFQLPASNRLFCIAVLDRTWSARSAIRYAVCAICRATCVLAVAG
jgi:hypothetical protein